ncbi:MAG: hypothetical protein ABEJ89_01195 [Haloarculaceae archaeon]
MSEPSERAGGLDLEPGPTAVGLLFGLAGLLFLLEPVVGAVALGPVRARPVALSGVALTVGFAVGAVVFARRGNRTAALAHGVFALAWAGLVAGVAFGSGTVVLGGFVVLVVGAFAIVLSLRS